MRLGDDDRGEEPFLGGDDNVGDDCVGIASVNEDVDRHGDG